MRAKYLMRTLVFAFKNNHPVLIKSAPGIGKSEIVEQAARKLNYDLMIVHPVVEEPTDQKGIPWVVDGKARFIPLHNLERMITAKKELVVFIDDLGQATPAVQASYMQLLLARQINGHKISDFVRFVAATNRREDKSGVTGILEAIKSRFDIIVELEMNVGDWIDWALRNGVPHEFISFTKFKPSLLHQFKPSRDIENYPCPRTVTKAGRMFKNGIDVDLRYEILKGCVGEAYAIEFETYLKVFMSLPTIGQIENDPYGSPIPNEISAKFAVSGMIAANIKTENANALISYLDKVDKELTIATMKNISVSNPKVTASSAFTQWMIRNGKELIEL